MNRLCLVFAIGAAVKIFGGVSGIAQPGAVEPQVQKTSYGWEIIDWKTADTNHEGEAVFTVTPETPLQNATVLSYIDDKLVLEPLAPGETRTSLVFRLPLKLKRAQGGGKKAAAPGSQWAGFGSGEADYGVELPFVSTLPLRVVNVAEDAVVTVSSADKLSTGFRPLGWLNRPETLTDGFIDRDRNFFSAPRDQEITADAPESVLLSWNDEQSLRLLGLMRGRGEKGFGDVRVEIYTGTGDPRFARDGWELCTGRWTKAGSFRALSLFDFGHEVKTRAVRLVCTGGVKQIGLGEVLALRALGDAPVPVARKTKGRVPVQFTIPDSGKVTVQIRNAKGEVVANPVAGVEFRKGTHTVYWDLTDVEGNPVSEPGNYSWKGLYVPGLKVAYQYSYYPAPLNNVPWQTPNRDGGWLADHEPPRTICRVGDKMWLGAFAEMGDSIIEVDNSANKLWGIDRIWVAIPSEICADGDYYYGFCEGGWIGDNQAIIQIDTKTKAFKKVFQRELKQAKGFFKNDGVSGFQVVGDRAFAAFAKTNTIMVFDISAGIRAKPRGFSWDSAYKQFDELKPVLIKEISLPAPGRIRQYGPDRLVAVSGHDIVTIDLKTYEVKPLIAGKLVNPLGLGTDAKGNLYVGEGAPLHQVFGYTPDGRRFLTLGKPGRREPGAFDTDNLEEPFGVEVASDGRIWVTEHTDWTRRVSIWDPQTAKCVKAVYGPTQYGGDGCIDPADETRVFYKGMEFRRDPATGAVTPLNMTYRADNTNIASFIQGSALGEDGNYPSYAFRAKTRKGLFSKDDLWFTSYMHPHGHPVLVLWLYKKGVVKPVAAMGSAYSLRTTFGEPQPDKRARDARTNTDFLTKHIPGYTSDQKFFTWTDLNDDGKIGVDELKFGKLEYEGKLLESATAGWNWRMNKNFVAAANAGEKRAVFFIPSGFTKHGYPIYPVPTNTVPGSGEGLITDSQNNAIILGGPLTCVTPEGKIKWTYRNQWPGLHAGHATTARGDEPGVLIAPTRVWGVVPVSKELGEVVAFNSNLGCTYLMTAEDGLYIDRVFRDQRVGLLWNSPKPPTPEVLAETSLYDEHFGGLLQKTVGPDGREKFVYVVGKNHCSVVELTGLDQIQRLSGGVLTVTSETVAEAQQRRQDEILRTAQPKIYTVRKVPDGSITVDVHDREWNNPERIEGFALAYDSQNLYIHFRGQDDKAVFENKGVNPIELFKTGDVLDVMLQTKKGLKPRADAGEGDIRLSFAMFDGKPVCVLYDFKIAGHQGERVPFSSPVRTI